MQYVLPCIRGYFRFGLRHHFHYLRQPSRPFAQSLITQTMRFWKHNRATVLVFGAQKKVSGSLLVFYTLLLRALKGSWQQVSSFSVTIHKKLWSMLEKSVASARMLSGTSPRHFSSLPQRKRSSHNVKIIWEHIFLFYTWIMFPSLHHHNHQLWTNCL